MFVLKLIFLDQMSYINLHVRYTKIKLINEQYFDWWARPLEDPGELAGVGVQSLARLVGTDLAPAEVGLLRHHLACTARGQPHEDRPCHTHQGRTSPWEETSSAFSAAPRPAASPSLSSSCSPHFSTSWTHNCKLFTFFVSLWHLFL